MTTIEFIFLVNRQGQTRLAQYSTFMPIVERTALEGEVVRKCLQRRDTDCNFLDHLHYKLVYRRYASLFFIVGLNNRKALREEVNGESFSLVPANGFDTDTFEEQTQGGELAIYEFIQLLVETLDKYFGNVCELDVMFNLEKVHFIVEEMFVNGRVGETNKLLVLQPVVMMDKESKGL
ncbi:AP-4 complex subunit sigma-1 [Trypanosoma brucei equiperdum]|uniref:AP complex subunit sigma n=1 Tax=Trypanosoma brucei equiperdum TaxID=630700 RepID=A0A3L6L0A5_9TRYP|nr:AP-4 complex subunit sigma-1 [Trypanosoma brucei equiperdum]